ncbi:MAG: Ldh family oxidoreductase [Boseongicola sp.]
MKIPLSKIEDTANAALVAHGAGVWQAAEVARAVARAEETGNIICGLYYLESYCKQLVTGRVNGTVEPETSKMRSGAVAVDARYGFAQPAFSRGLPLAIDSARECGIASLSVAHSHTCTSLGFFTEQIAMKGLIALGFTNASAIVSGPGGKTPVIGTNPIAITFPGDHAPRFHADFSTAAVALGKITMAKAAGEKIPLGWAVDSNGRPTEDPGAALEGSLVSAANHKGWALGLVVELLASGLTGSANSREVSALKAEAGPPHNLGQYYILIDPSDRTDGLKSCFDHLLLSLESDPEVRVPGMNRRTKDPVEVDGTFWAFIQRLAGEK